MSSMYPSSGGAVARQCQRCGAMIAPQMSQCPQCGMFAQPAVPGQQAGFYQQGMGPGPAGSSWGSQVAQTPPQFPTGGLPGSSTGWGTAGQMGAWGQNQPSSPSQQLPQSSFAFPPSTSQSAQAGFSNPSASSLFNTPGAFPQSPGQSALNNSPGMFPSNPGQAGFTSGSGMFPSNPGQAGFTSGSGMFPGNPGQAGFTSGSGMFPGNPGQAALNNAFAPAQQNTYGTTRSGMLQGQIQTNWQAYQGGQFSANGDEEDEDEDEDEGGRKRPGVLAILGIIVLVVVLVGGLSIGALAFLRKNHATANTSTPLVIVTPTGTPLFKDTFQNNNNNWDTSEPSGATISIQGGKMVLASNNNELFEELLPGNQTFSDVRVDVDANLTKGAQQNGYGIYIRGSLADNGALGTYYRFEVYGDGNFAIYEGVQSSSGALSTNTIVAETANSAILFAGQTNHLTVIAKGSQMSFLVNGVQVYTFSNDSYKSGSIALFVSNVQNVAAGAEATFTNLAVFPAS